jgi:hypothetical protein
LDILGDNFYLFNMTKVVQEAFAPIAEYFISMSVDTVTGFHILEIGIPDKWAFSDSRDIKCEVLAESEEGKVLKISSHDEQIVIDDLIEFVCIIVDTNIKIVMKEEEFKEKMNEMKKMLEDEANKFYAELDMLKDNSFKRLAEELNPNPNDSNTGQKKRTYNKKATYKPITLTGTTS